MAKRRALKLPGRVFEMFAAKVDEHLDEDEDLDLCEALSEAQVKPRGAGVTVLVPLEPAQSVRLAGWVGDGDPKVLRDYARAIKDQAAALPDDER